MLRDADAVATVAVKDLKVAGQFYRDTLGLDQVASEGDDAIAFGSGDTTIELKVAWFKDPDGNILNVVNR